MGDNINMKRFLKNITSALLLTTMVGTSLLGISGCGKKDNKDSEAFSPRLDTQSQVVLNVTGFFGN